MYFYVLVLLHDNGRLLGDNARRSEDSVQQLIIMGCFRMMVLLFWKWKVVTVTSGWKINISSVVAQAPCGTIPQPTPSAAPDKVVCNSPSINSTATVRCYTIGANLMITFIGVSFAKMSIIDHRLNFLAEGARCHLLVV